MSRLSPALQLQVKKFSTEPIDALVSHLLMTEQRLTLHEALAIDLTDYMLIDWAYRYEHDGDVAMNFKGPPNKGKSNCLVWAGLKWSSITGVPYDMAKIVQNTVEYNMLLKGLKVVDLPENKIDVQDFEQLPGTHASLDEASDVNRTGPLAMTTVMQTTDLEKRMRGLQIARFCAGVDEILHQAYYGVHLVERNTKQKICHGVLYVKNKVDNKVETVYLGGVHIPYVQQDLFDRYYKPKIKSIKSYGKGHTATRVAQIMDFFATELKSNDEFQSLPKTPPDERINYLQKNPRYSVWTTVGYFQALEKLARLPKEEKEPYSRGPF